MERKLLKPIYECRCNGRLQTKRFTRLAHTGSVDGRGTGTPKDKDEVNTREVCECEGWVWDLDAIGAPSRLRTTRQAAALARARPTLLFKPVEKAERRKWKNPPLVGCADWTPEAAKKRSVSRWVCKNKSLTNSLCNLPLVLAIAGIKDTALGGLLL